jgi:hypothetical protein
VSAITRIPHPGHSANKSVSKPAAINGPMPVVEVPAEVIAKQQRYLEQARALQERTSTLSITEQESQRAALKREILGD